MLEKWVFGLFKKEIISLVERSIRLNNINSPFKNGVPGPDWFTNFRKRHGLSLKKDQSLEHSRKTNPDPFVIHEYNKEAVSEWVKIFPQQVTETYTSSVTFMKQLTVIAVSAITYMKSILPEDSYTTETFGGLKLKLLKKKCRDEDAQFVSSAITQAFKAFEKKYLHQLVLYFYDRESSIDSLVEYHVFEYQYDSDEVSLNVHSNTRGHRHLSHYTFENIRHKTLCLIRKLLCTMQMFESRTAISYDIAFRLYYNDAAPEGYQAPGFLPSEESQDPLEPTIDDPIQMGSLHTPFHSFTLRSYISNISSSNEANPTQNPPVMSSNEEFEANLFTTSDVPQDAPPEVRCACDKTDLDVTTRGMLQCRYCHTLQHAACYGLRRLRTDRARNHCCATCNDANPERTPIDTRIVSLTVSQRMCLALFRRAVDLAAGVRCISVRDLMYRFSLSPVNASRLMKMLQKSGVVEHSARTDLTSPLRVITENLQNILGEFFKNDGFQENTDVVDQLVAEAMSKGTQSDPIARVLGSNEKADLQNTATLYKYVAPLPKPQFEDETLKLYRDAILANEVAEEGLPLSGSHNPVDVNSITPVKRTVNASASKTDTKSKRSKR